MMEISEAGISSSKDKDLRCVIDSFTTASDSDAGEVIMALEIPAMARALDPALNKLLRWIFISPIHPNVLCTVAERQVPCDLTGTKFEAGVGELDPPRSHILAVKKGTVSNHVMPHQRFEALLNTISIDELMSPAFNGSIVF
jgi:hypothetical protein